MGKNNPLACIFDVSIDPNNKEQCVKDWGRNKHPDRNPVPRIHADMLPKVEATGALTGHVRERINEVFNGMSPEKWPEHDRKNGQR